MKFTTKVFSLAVALICGSQSINAQLPTTEAPIPTYPASDVVSFFSISSDYPSAATLVDYTGKWGSKSSYEFVEFGDYSSAMKLKDLDKSWGIPIQVDPQVRIIDHRYLHLDIFCNEDTRFRVGLQRHYPDGMEVYFSDMNVPGGSWYSVDIEISTLPNYGANALEGQFGNVTNYLRFGNDPNDDFSGYSSEIYVANMYMHTPWTSSSVGEVSNESFKLYPTIVTDEFVCENPEGIAEIAIYDITGKLVNTYAVADISKSVSVSSLNAGCYIVSVKMNNGSVVSKRIIKQ